MERAHAIQRRNSKSSDTPSVWNQHEQASITEAEDKCKKRCGVINTNPTHTTGADTKEAASLHAYLLVTARSHTVAKASKSHVLGM